MRTGLEIELKKGKAKTGQAKTGQVKNRQGKNGQVTLRGQAPWLYAAAGILFAGAEVIGGGVYRTGSVGPLFSSGKRAALTLLLFLASAFMSTLVFFLLAKMIGRIQEQGQRSRAGEQACPGQTSRAGEPARPDLTSRAGKITQKLNAFFRWKFCWIILAALILLSFVVCYAAYYPGIFSYDMPEQTAMALGQIPVSRFHPPLHTYFWKVCLKLEGVLPVRAIVIASVIQMLFMTAVLVRTLVWMAGRQVSGWVLLIGLVFLLFNPIIGIFSIVLAKDVTFAGFFLLFVIRFAQLLTDRDRFLRSPISVLAIGADILLCCLLRNNAMYAFLVMVPVALLIPGRRRWVSGLVFLVPILLYLFINGPIYNALGVEEGNVREMYSVPVQQIARVAAREGDALDEGTRKEINRYLKYWKIRKKYNPRFADPVKATFKNDNYEEDKAGFFKLWLKLLRRYPGHFVDAFLDLNIPYWYPGADPIDLYSGRSYIETKIHPSPYYTFERPGRFPRLYDFYEKAANYSLFRKVPVLSAINALYFPIWFLLAGSLLLIRYFRRRGKGQLHRTLLFLPVILFWLTYLIGPVSNARYIFPIILMYPVILAAAVQPEQLLGKG